MEVTTEGSISNGQFFILIIFYLIETKRVSQPDFCLNESDKCQRKMGYF